jgi:hypothetical protein
MVEAVATKIAGLVGMMKDAMMTGVTRTGVTRTAVMRTGDTKVDEGVGGEDTQKFQFCLGPFDSVHNLRSSTFALDTAFASQFSICVSAGRPSMTHPPSRYRYYMSSPRSSPLVR